MPALGSSVAAILAGVLALLIVAIVGAWLTLRHIPNQQVGIVEKLWSRHGSVGEGRIIALDGEAGYRADLLRGGLHFGLWRWQYRVHKVSLVTVPQGKIGYVYARDGESLPPSQTLGRIVPCNHFQDARAFLGEPNGQGTEANRGQRGRQRAILREGVYAINPALFVVITEDAAYRLGKQWGQRELETVMSWQAELRRIDGFSPVVVGASLRSLETRGDDESFPRRPRSRAEAGEQTVRCPGCGHTFAVPPSDTPGDTRTVKCPNCAQPVRIVGAVI